jgi:hypothetical protein
MLQKGSKERGSNYETVMYGYTGKLLSLELKIQNCPKVSQLVSNMYTKTSYECLSYFLILIKIVQNEMHYVPTQNSQRCDTILQIDW